jgi:glycosyltransferase involved in cell wall biosynthesis
VTHRGFVFNGKFLSSRATGVHRVASEFVRGIDEILSEGASTPSGNSEEDWLLMCPRDATASLPLCRIQRRGVGVLTKQAWEQIEAPWYVDGRLLVSLCNMAPLLTRGSVTLIHDAHVFVTPQSGSLAFNAWYRFALPRIGRAAARIVTVSDYSLEQLVHYGVAPRSKITVIRNGADHLLRATSDNDVLRHLGLTSRGYVLAVANSQEHKNVQTLFRAFDALQAHGIGLVVVGPDDRAAFDRKGWAAPPAVVFAGYRSDPELRALYEQALCLAFPSTTEGCGLPPLEAMTLSCPVLTTRCGALEETCGDAAIYLDPFDPSAWADAAVRLADASQRLELVEKGRRHAAQFRWRDSAGNLLQLIRSVSSKRTA